MSTLGSKASALGRDGSSAPIDCVARSSIGRCMANDPDESCATRHHSLEVDHRQPSNGNIQGKNELTELKHTDWRLNLPRKL